MWFQLKVTNAVSGKLSSFFFWFGLNFLYNMIKITFTRDCFIYLFIFLTIQLISNEGTPHDLLVCIQ